jgi:hypothetical protein
MRAIKHILAPIFFGGLVIAVSFLILWTSLDFQECVKTHGANDPSGEHLKEGVPRIVSTLLTWRHCGGAYVLDKNAVITALGTVVIAIFTIILGVFTVRLAQSTRVAADAAKEAAELARQEFTATHRPKIVLYGMNVELPGDINASRHVTFRYVNAGDTDAFVTSIASRVLWAAKSMVPADIEFRRHDVIKAPILVPSGKNGFAITPEGVDFVALVRSGRGGPRHRFLRRRHRLSRHK